MNNETKHILEQIVERIKNNVNPDKIILFGSQAQGKTMKDSDIDLLVIKDSQLRRDDRDKEIRPFLKDIIFPLDIMVYTKKEVARLQGHAESFVGKIIDTGKVLYERKVSN